MIKPAHVIEGDRKDSVSQHIQADTIPVSPAVKTKVILPKLYIALVRWLHQLKGDQRLIKPITTLQMNLSCFGVLPLQLLQLLTGKV